ncbi:MAG: hypothetical protein JWN48_4214 [Myxococcaceae bacterium]|nr:hypothetical protein [Myxococcaceae bacterium]
MRGRAPATISGLAAVAESERLPDLFTTHGQALTIRLVALLKTRRASSPADLAFVTLEPHYVLASWRMIGIAVWIDETPVGAIRAAQGLLERLALECPDGIAFLQVIGESNQSIETPARDALKELLRASRGALRAAPVVYEGTGFRAAAIRAIVTGLLSQRSYGFSHRVYSTLEDGALATAREFEKREPTRFARELCEAMGNLRDAHARAFPSAPQSFIRYKG